MPSVGNGLEGLGRPGTTAPTEGQVALLCPPSGDKTPTSEHICPLAMALGSLLVTMYPCTRTRFPVPAGAVSDIRQTEGTVTEGAQPSGTGPLGCSEPPLD